MLCVKNGMIIDPVEDRIYAGDLWIEEGIIKRIVKRGQEGEPVPENAKVLDAEGLMIGPGLIDTHVHFRDPGFTYKEDIISGGEAAKKGGYTGIVLMANTKPCVDNPETLKYVLEKGKQTGIRIETCANVTREMKGKEIVNMEELFRAGAVGFTDDGIPLLDEDLVREAMKRAFRLGCPISFHEENPERILNNGIHEGKASGFYGIGGSKREAETDLIERDVELALETGACIVIQHISTREGVEIVRRARASGAHVHAEATPHHFTLTQEAVIEKGTLAKMNPPLREEADRLAIIEGIADGTIDLIATDHAPHSREEKAQEITKAPSGIIGLETAFSLGIRELIEKGYLTYPQLFHRMSTAPASLYGQKGGCLKEGGVADLIIFDSKRQWTVKEFVSKSENSPFIGETMPGVICYTFCKGRMVYKEKKDGE